MLEKIVGMLVVKGLKHLAKKSTNTVDDTVIDVVEKALPLVVKHKG